MRGISETDAAFLDALSSSQTRKKKKKTDAPQVLLPLVPEDSPVRGLRGLRVVLDDVGVLGFEADCRSGGELRVFLGGELRKMKD